MKFDIRETICYFHEISDAYIEDFILKTYNNSLSPAEKEVISVDDPDFRNDCIDYLIQKDVCNGRLWAVDTHVEWEEYK